MKLIARSLLLFFALLGLSSASGPGLYRGGSKVVNLTDKNIEKAYGEPHHDKFLSLNLTRCNGAASEKERSGLGC